MLFRSPSYQAPAPLNFQLAPYFSAGNWFNNYVLCPQVGYSWPAQSVPGYTNAISVPAISVKTPGYGFIQMGCPDAIWYGDSFYTSGGGEGAYMALYAMPVPGSAGQQAAPHMRRTAANALFQDRSVRTLYYSPGNYYPHTPAVMYQQLLK